MTTLRAAISDDLHEAVLAQAEREHISVDALIARTLRAAIARPQRGGTRRARKLGGFRPHHGPRPGRAAGAGG